MHISIDKVGVYNYCIRGTDGRSGKEGFRIAQQIEAMIADDELSAGSVIATEAILRQQLQTGHSTLRQAIRILESRYACRMRRGPGGGLFVTKPTREDAIAAIVGYLRADGAEASELTETLAKLDSLASTTPSTSKYNTMNAAPSYVGAIAMQSSNSVLSFFATAVDNVLQRSRLEMTQRGDFESKTVTSAAKFANELAVHIQQQRELSTADIWLGTEEELCDRYAVTRTVLRQALCILEADGTSTARRGRSGGVLACKSNPGRAIAIVAGYLSSSSSLHEDEVAVAQALYTITTTLACARWSEADDRSFRTLTQQGIPQLGGTATMSCFDIEWKAMHNRVLEFIMRALAAYNTRFLTSGFSASTASMKQLHDSHIDRLRAIANQDVMRAEQIFAQRLSLFEKLNLMPNGGANYG